MTERERLIELIRQGMKKHEVTIENYVIPTSDYLADYLLANGIILLPCKVGDVVYVIEPCTCYNDYSEFDECNHRRTNATKWIEMVRVPTKHHTKCLKLFKRPFKAAYLNKFGKTVFLTREEAEKALKERESNEV